MEEKIPLWTKDFILICIAQLAVSTSFFATSTVLPIFLEAQLGIAGLLLGITVACYTITTILFRPLVGYLLDHWGRKIIYLPSYFFFGLLFFFYPFVGALAGMILLRLAHGIFWGASLGAAGTVVVDLTPVSRRGEGLGFFGLTASIGMALGPALGVMVVEDLGYEALFAGCSAFLLVFFLFTLTLRVPKVEKSDRKLSIGALVEKTSLPMAFVVMVLAVPYGGMITYTAKYVASGQVNASAGIFFVSLALGMAVCRVLAGKRFDRSGPVLIMTYCFIFIVGGYLMLALTRSAWPFYGAAFVLGLGYGIAFPVCSAMVNHLVEADRRGAANATFWTIFDIGICSGIILTSFAQEEFGWRATQIAETAAVVLAMTLFWLKSLPHYLNTLHTSRPNLERY